MKIALDLLLFDIIYPLECDLYEGKNVMTTE